MEIVMQTFNRKLLILAIALCIALPLNGMFIQKKTFGRLKQMQQKAAQKRSFELSQPINIKSTINQPTEIKKSNFFSWFSNFSKPISNWWYGPPLEEKLSTWSSDLNTIIKTYAKTDLNTAIQLLKNLKKLQPYADTASYKHLNKYISDIIKKYPSMLINPNLFNMVKSALQKEKEENDLGYETFYNVRKWQYNFISDIYTMLYEYKSGTILNAFVFTHFDDSDSVLEKIHPRFFESEKAKHELLLKKGNIPDIAGYETLLFLNKFLFGNVTNYDPGTCSIYFLLSNENNTPKNISIQEIFAMFGDFNIYNMYKEKLQNLQQEHNALSQYGELLTIAIPKNKVDQSVYHSSAFGYKEAFLTQDLKIISDSTDILNSLNQNLDDDGSEFAMPNTKIIGPNSGIKVFSFNAVDTDKMKAFKEKEEILFAEIIQSMKEEDSKKVMEAASRE